MLGLELCECAIIEEVSSIIHERKISFDSGHAVCSPKGV